MKLKSIHLRSPKDDQDISCFLMKSEDDTNVDPEHAHEPIDCLIVNPSDEQDPLQNNVKLSDDLLQATNELGSLLSKINSNEPQVLIINTPPRGTAGENTMNLEPELAFIQGNILLFNQNTKAKIAEKNVLNMFSRKYFRTWYQLYKSARWNRLRLKKNMMKVWKRVVDNIEIPSDSTETFVDSMPRRNQKPFQPHPENLHGSNPKVLIVDMESEDLSSFPPSFFHPHTQTLPLSPNSHRNSQQQPNTRKTTPIIDKKPKTPVNRQIQKQPQQKPLLKHYLLPTQASQPHPLPQEPVYHITRTSPTYTSNTSPAGQEDKTQLSSLSKGSGSHFLHPQLSMKYPNYHLINNYMKLYEQEELQRQHEAPKPKKLFKTTPSKSGRSKIIANSQHKSVSSRSEPQSQQSPPPQRIRDPSTSESSPHPLKQFKQIGFQNLNPQHLQFQLSEKSQVLQDFTHPAMQDIRNHNDRNTERENEDGDAASVVSSLSSTSNTRRQLLQRADKSNLSKEKLSRLNQQLREEKLQQSQRPVAEMTNPQTLVIQQMTQNIAPTHSQANKRNSPPTLQLEISPIRPEELNNNITTTTTTTSSGNQFTPSSTINNYTTTNNNNPASLSSLMFKNRNQFAHLLENDGRDNASLCNIDSSSSLPNQIDYLSVDDRNNESDNSSSLPTFGRKLKQKMQKYHSQSPVMEPTSQIASSVKQEDALNPANQLNITVVNRRGSTPSSYQQQPLSSPAMIVPASLPERKLSFRGSIISIPAAVPIPVIPLGSPGEETIVTKENSPTHSNKLLPAPQVNPLQSRLALIKHRIVLTNTKPSLSNPSRENSSPTEHESAEVPVIAELNTSPIFLTEKRKLQLMRRFFIYSKQLLQLHSFSWQLYEQSSYFHRLRLKRKYFRNLRQVADVIAEEKEYKRLSKQNSKNRLSNSLRKREKQTNKTEDFYDEQLTGEQVDHIWGDNSLAKAFHFQKWRKFLQRTSIWRQKEEDVAHQLDITDMRHVLNHWLSFAQEQRKRNHDIQEKLQRSPLAKYYSPVSNAPASIASSLTQSPFMSRFFTSPETDARSVPALPPAMTAPAASAARRLSLSVEHPDKNEKDGDDGEDNDSFALSRDDNQPISSQRALVDSQNNNQLKQNNRDTHDEDDESSILFPFDDNDSIYLSVSSFSGGSHHEDHHHDSPPNQTITNEIIPRIPIFIKKRFYSLFQCYQSTSYYQNYTKLKVIEKLLNFAIQKKWQRELSHVMQRNYRKKFLYRIFQAWKDVNREEKFAQVYQTYDSDYESTYGSYDSNA